jgi:voltage-gated sodium channel
MFHQRIKTFAQSKQFCHFVNYLIIAFAILVGVENIVKDELWVSFFVVADYFFLAFFTLEILLRIIAEDHPLEFFRLFTREKVVVDGRTLTRYHFTEHGFWNYFDFILIAFSLVGFFAQLFLRPTFIQIGRLFRIFRIIRLLEVSEHLKEVEKRIVSIVPTVFSFAVLLMILMYIYSILGMYMFGAQAFATCSFSNLMDSFITLFQIMTLDNWSDVMDDLKAHSPHFPPFVVQLYFVSFVIFTSIIAFNVFVAVMTSQVQDRMEKDIEKKVVEAQESAENSRLTAGMKEILTELQLLKAEMAALRNK